ncbi:MAG: glutathione S-transferase family protein [Pseudomonadota bacterium]
MGSAFVQLFGAPASPYTRKMVSLLRYRQIPYEIHWGDATAQLLARGVEPPKPALLPTFLFRKDNPSLPYLGEGEPVARCDSTPIIRLLEQCYEARSVIPEDPALRFLDYLIEDFADEWGTKYMFHYRWYDQLDIENAGTLLPLMIDPSLDPATHEAFKKAFSERQVSRLYVVGSTPSTAPIIDASYERFLTALSRVLEERLFLFGARPSAADFALFGQLSQCVGMDPTPRQLTHDRAPRVVAWVQLLEDLCGLQPQSENWLDRDSVAEQLKPLLEEIGRVYVPALLTNARACEEEEKTWSTQIDGANWEQRTFPYQAKCLRWIREEFAALNDADRRWVYDLMESVAASALLSEESQTSSS